MGTKGNSDGTTGTGSVGTGSVGTGTGGTSVSEKTVIGGVGPAPQENARPILVVQTAFIGDLILSIPLLKKIRERRPFSPLFVVVRKGLGHFLKELGIVDGYFEIEKGNWSSYKELAQRLSSVTFLWIVCPHESVRTAFFISKLKADCKIGFEKWWSGFFFSELEEKNMGFPDPLRQLSLLKPVDGDVLKLYQEGKFLGLSETGKDGFLPAVPEWSQISFRSRILEWPDPFMLKAPYVCVFPGSVWPTKRWIESGFAEVGRGLQARGFLVVWMGSKDEIALCAGLEKQVPGSVSLCGKTSLTHTLTVLARASGVVSNDSGGQHLAALAGAPVVSIFGPTVRSLGFRPWGPGMIVEKQGLACRPCGKHGHKKCPIGTHECMTTIAPKSVLDAFVALNFRYNPSR